MQKTGYDVRISDWSSDVCSSDLGLPQCSMPMQVLVGIGNPGGRYDNTPHNVGWAVLDALAERLALAWTAHEDVLLAHTRLNGETLLLVKPQTYVNNTGRSQIGRAHV